MEADLIAEIGIDSLQRLYVKPSNASFSHIYRAGMEIYWEQNGRFLYSPKPREWTHFDWFRQILKAVASEYAVTLLFTLETKWHDVPEELQLEIQNWMTTKQT